MTIITEATLQYKMILGFPEEVQFMLNNSEHKETKNGVKYLILKEDENTN
jgi:hypothetical protein